MPVVAAALAGAAISAVAGTTQSIIQAEHDRKRAHENQELTRELYDESRAMLPPYARDTEMAWFSDVAGQYRDLGPETPSVQDYRNIVNAAITEAAPSTEGAVRTMGGIYTGATERELLEAERPVAEALRTGAQAKIQAGLEGLQRELNQINAINAGMGDSFAARKLRTAASTRIFQQGAADTTSANLAIAQGERSAKQNAINMRVANLGAATNLPLTLANQGVQLRRLPVNAAMQSMADRSAMLGQFKVGPSSPPYAFMQMPSTVAPGAAVAGNVSQLAAGLGNYAANQQLANEWNAANPTYRPQYRSGATEADVQWARYNQPAPAGEEFAWAENMGY